MMLKIVPKATEAPVPAGPLVVALAYDGLCTFEFAIAAEVFGQRRPEFGREWYRFAACGVEPGPLRAQGGLRVEVDGGFELIAAADLIIVPGWKGPDAPVPEPLIEALGSAHARGARLASICSGSFVLAATGLLDGRRAATHWIYAEAMRQAFPAVEIDAGVLYVEEERIFTSAGSAAGIDLLLHIIRGDLGAEAANRVARRMIVQPHRRGGQAQFIDRPVPAQAQSRLAPLLDRVRAEPARDWSVRAMAREAAMSERSFFRRFSDALGCAPGAWVTQVRIDEAKRLLEATALPVEEVARLAGFGSVATLRHHFGRAAGLSPRDYRDRFGHRRGRGSERGTGPSEGVAGAA